MIRWIMKYIPLLLICVLLGCSSNKKQQAPVAGVPVINLSENVIKVSSLPLSEAVAGIEVAGAVSDGNIVTDDAGKIISDVKACLLYTSVRGIQIRWDPLSEKQSRTPCTQECILCEERI